MKLLLLLVLMMVFFVVGVYAGGFMAIVCWGMAAGSFVLAIDS